MAETFNDSKEVIQVKDKEAGIITGSGNFRYVIPGLITREGIIGLMVDITVKVESRIRLYQFMSHSTPSYSSEFRKTPIEKNYFNYLSEKIFPREGRKYYQAIEDNILKIMEPYKST